MIAMEMKATLQGANVKGYACAKKSMVKMLLKKIIDDDDIFAALMERMDALPGDTVYIDLDMKMSVGNE